MKNEVKNAIIMTFVVIVILVIVYLTTAIFMTGEIGNNKKDDKNDTTTNNESQSELYDNMIIASNTFNQKNEEYNVIFFHEKDDNDALKNSISAYDSSQKDIKLYKVNLDEAINKFVISKQQNSSATNYEELKINDVTLINIKNKVITSYVTGYENVISKLK